MIVFRHLDLYSDRHLQYRFELVVWITMLIREIKKYLLKLLNEFGQSSKLILKFALTIFLDMVNKT